MVPPRPSRAYQAHRPVPGLVLLKYFTAAFLSLTLVTDFAYVQTTVLMWQDFSRWLLFFGLVTGGVAVLFWLADIAIHRQKPVWSATILFALVLASALLNSLVHAGDGWTAIVPWGIGLSAVTCLLMIAVAFLNRSAAVDRPLYSA